MHLAGLGYVTDNYASTACCPSISRVAPSSNHGYRNQIKSMGTQRNTMWVSCRENRRDSKEWSEKRRDGEASRVPASSLRHMGVEKAGVFTVQERKKTVMTWQCLMDRRTLSNKAPARELWEKLTKSLTTANQSIVLKLDISGKAWVCFSRDCLLGDIHWEEVGLKREGWEDLSSVCFSSSFQCYGETFKNT